MIYNLHFTSFHTYTTCAHNSSHHATHNNMCATTSLLYACCSSTAWFYLHISFVFHLLQVNLSMFITCCVADVYWQYCVCWCIVMCGCACNARPWTLSSRTCFLVCVCMLSSVCLAFHICVLCNVLWVVSSSRSAEVLLQGQGQLKSWGYVAGQPI